MARFASITDVYRAYVDLCGSEMPVRDLEEVHAEWYAREMDRYEDDGRRFLDEIFADGWAWGEAPCDE